MIIAGLRFRPALVPTIAAGAVFAAALLLGNWQLNRAQEKRELQQEFERREQAPALAVPAHPVAAADYRYRKVKARGEFDPAQTIYLDNKVYHGTPGYQVVAPLRIEGGRIWVLVNRGWMAKENKPSGLGLPAFPAGVVEVEGTAVVPGARVFELSADTVEGRRWQNLTLERYRAATGLDVQPIVILQTGGEPDGLIRDWDRPDTGIERHLGYAFQWFALAATALAYYLVVSVKRAGVKQD